MECMATSLSRLVVEPSRLVNRRRRSFLRHSGSHQLQENKLKRVAQRPPVEQSTPTPSFKKPSLLHGFNEKNEETLSGKICQTTDDRTQLASAKRIKRSLMGWTYPTSINQNKTRLIHFPPDISTNQQECICLPSNSPSPSYRPHNPSSSFISSVLSDPNFHFNSSDFLSSKFYKHSTFLNSPIQIASLSQSILQLSLSTFVRASPQISNSLLSFITSSSICPPSSFSSQFPLISHRSILNNSHPFFPSISAYSPPPYSSSTQPTFRHLSTLSSEPPPTPTSDDHHSTHHDNNNPTDTLPDGNNPSAHHDHQPTMHQLRLVLITSCIPFIGFGFVDNFCMLLFGDYLDTTLCVRFGFSTLAAAAWGNLMSDVLGIKLGESIELVANKITTLQPNLSTVQMTMRRTRRFYYAGCTIGMSIGCVLGMTPLLFLDTEEAERRKRKKAQDALFGQLSADLAQCLDAESVVVYIVERSPACQALNDIIPKSEGLNDSAKLRRHLFGWFSPENETKKKKCICRNPGCQLVASRFLSRDPMTERDIRVAIASGVPGLVFSTKKVVHFRPHATSSSSPEALSSPLLAWIPFSKPGQHELGLVEVSNIPKTSLIDDTEPQLPTPLATPAQPSIRQAIGVPIFGADGDVIGVIEIRNPKDKPSFTRQDKELLLSISSHVAVEIQGQQHITNILGMCRNQVTARRDVLKLSTAELPPPSMSIKPPPSSSSLDQQSTSTLLRQSTTQSDFDRNQQPTTATSSSFDTTKK